jgi:general secretion pathway protein D
MVMLCQNARSPACRWVLLLLMLSLSGCASYRAHRDGMSDVAGGRLADGVLKLAQASELAPDDAAYKRDYLGQRDQAVNRLVRQADLDTLGGRYEQALAVYAEVLRMSPGNDRAQAGVNAVDVARRHAAALELASDLTSRQELDAAIAKVQQVLSESPQHRKAGALLKQLLRQQAAQTGKELGIYPSLKAIYKTPVSLSFGGATLKQVLDAMKLASGLNYMLDKDVQADLRVNISVTQKPVEDVLRLLLATHRLTYRVLDTDTLLIYPNTQAKAADYKELVVRSFYLNSAEASKVSGLLKSVAKVKDVYVDERINLIVVRDSAEVIRLAEKLVAAADMAEPEVMLELEVMEVSVSRLQQLGIQWPSSVSASLAGSTGVAGRIALNEVNFPLSNGLFTLSVSDPFMSARLLAQNGDSNILANPRVRVRNKQQAKIMIGDKVPVVTVVNTPNVGTTESVSYLDVGLKLEIEPTISLDDEVAMKVGLEVSNVVDTITRASGTQTYRLGTRNTSTVLRVKDGETNVLAGLIQNEDRRSNSGIPGLNALPLVSRLFGSGQDQTTKTEIVLLITPHIVRNLELPGVGMQEFLSGTENSAGAAPIQLNEAGLDRAQGKLGNPSEPLPPSVQRAPTAPGSIGAVLEGRPAARGNLPSGLRPPASPDELPPMPAPALQR